MKRIIVAFIVACLLVIPLGAAARGITPKRHRSIAVQYDSLLQATVINGDIDRNGKVNVLDLTALIDFLKAFHAMDVNDDNKIDSKDIQVLVEIIFGAGVKITITTEK